MYFNFENLFDYYHKHFQEKDHSQIDYESLILEYIRNEKEKYKSNSPDG